MQRIHLLQQWYDLSDPAMEDSLIEMATMRRFAGIALIADRIPDEATILELARGRGLQMGGIDDLQLPAPRGTLHGDN